MTLQGKQVAILIDNFFEDAEAFYPFYRLKEAGADVVLVGPVKGKEYKGKYGYPVTPEKGIDDIRAGNFDAVIIPGGYAPDHMRRTQKMVDFVRDMGSTGKVVAGICHAGWMLVSAGLLKNKTATSFFAIKDDMKNAGCEWVDRDVVRDGNLITSRTPADLPVFCRTIIDALT